MCTQRPDWFIAAASGNVELMKRLQAKFVGQTDRRETNADLQQFNGFCAVHYAAYMGHAAALEFLLPLEHAKVTAELVVMECPGFSSKSKLKVPSGTTCLMIAVLRKQVAALQAIMKFYMENKMLRDQMFGTANQFNQTTLIFATMCGYPEAVELIEADAMRVELGKVMTGDFVPVFNAAAFGKLEAMKALARLQSMPDAAGDVNAMMLCRDMKNMNTYELAKQNMETDKFPLPRQQAEELLALTERMMKRAYATAETIGPEKLAAKAKAFLMGKPVSEVFGAGFEDQLAQVRQGVEALSTEQEKAQFLDTYFSSQ